MSHAMIRCGLDAPHFETLDALACMPKQDDDAPFALVVGGSATFGVGPADPRCWRCYFVGRSLHLSKHASS